MLGAETLITLRENVGIGLNDDVDLVGNMENIRIRNLREPLSIGDVILLN